MESTDSLRYILEELLHQIEFLEKSQKQLQNAIDEKYDEEFSVAIFENEVIIAAKRARAFRVHELLTLRDASYRAEPYIAEAGAALALAPVVQNVDVAVAVAEAAVLVDSGRGGIDSNNISSDRTEGGSSNSISDSTLSDRAGLYL